MTEDTNLSSVAVTYVYLMIDFRINRKGSAASVLVVLVLVDTTHSSRANVRACSVLMHQFVIIKIFL